MRPYLVEPLAVNFQDRQAASDTNSQGFVDAWPGIVICVVLILVFDIKLSQEYSGSDISRSRICVSVTAFESSLPDNFAPTKASQAEVVKYWSGHGQNGREDDVRDMKELR